MCIFYQSGLTAMSNRNWANFDWNILTQRCSKDNVMYGVWRNQQTADNISWFLLLIEKWNIKQSSKSKVRCKNMCPCVWRSSCCPWLWCWGGHFWCSFLSTWRKGHERSADRKAVEKKPALKTSKLHTYVQPPQFQYQLR